jgi:predicted transposase YbfD/YdcC
MQKTPQRCFTAWMASMLGALQESVAIDGKTLCASAAGNAAACHVVSAFAHVRAVKEKSNEIPAIPELLAALALEGCVVTIDAMGCQKAVADQMIEAGADYVPALKGNQGTLHDDVRLFFESLPAGVKTAAHETLDRGHGRVERRRCTVTADIGRLKQNHPWMGLATIARIESEVTSRGKTSTETRYFISSLPPDPVRLPAAARGHWGIESMHWQLDVTFRDDLATARKDHSALNLTTFKRAAYNLLRRNTKPIPLKHKRKKAAWNHDFLCQLLAA